MYYKSESIWRSVPTDLHYMNILISWALFKLLGWRNLTWSWSYFTNDGKSASLSWCRAPIWSPWPDFCILSDDCGFLNVRHPLSRGWVRNLLVQLLLCLARAITFGSRPRRTHDQFFQPHLRLPLPRGPGPRIYFPQEQGVSDTPQGTAFPLSPLTTRRATLEEF
jgi:hypothetical protein